MGEPLAGVHDAMSHAADRRCRAQACRALRGHAQDRVLCPLMPIESADLRGDVRVAYAGCGGVGVRAPTGSLITILDSMA